MQFGQSDTLATFEILLKINQIYYLLLYGLYIMLAVQMKIEKAKYNFEISDFIHVCCIDNF